MTEIDERIVQMKFDNSQFTKGVSDTLKSLKQLNSSLNDFEGAKVGFKDAAAGARECASSVGYLTSYAMEASESFDALKVIAITALSNITTAAMNAGKKIVSALIDPIVQGGKTRALNIANAKFQLEGLGVAWDDISQYIDYGVKDTAYGLDSAAKVASQLVASGQAVDDSMGSTLRGISGVAAMTNTTYDYVGDIFATVASNGKLMTMQLRQLSSQGLAVSAQIAKYMNKIAEANGQTADYTEAKINEMVTAGQIDFRTFSDAMDDAFGEHAKDANKTFTGALSNIKSALSRIGEMFWTPGMEAAIDVFNNIREDINAIQKSMKPAAALFTIVTTKVSDFASALHEAKDPINDTSYFMEAVAQLGIAIWSYIRPIANALVEVFSVGTDGLSTLGKRLKDFFYNLQLYGEDAEKVHDIFFSIFSMVKSWFTNVITLMKALSPLLSAGLELVQDIFNAVSPLFPIIADIISFASKFVSALINQVSKLIKMKLTDFLANLGTMLIGLATAALPKIIQLIKDIWTAVQPVIDFLKPGLAEILVGIEKTVYFVGTAIGYTISKLSDLSGTFSSVSDAIMGVYGLIFGVKSTLEDPIDLEGSVSGSVTDTASEAVDANEIIAESVEETAETVEEANDNITESTTKAARDINENYGKVADKVASDTDAINTVINKSGEDISKATSAHANIISDSTRRMTDKIEETTAESENKLDEYKNGIMQRMSMDDEVGDIGSGETSFIQKITLAIANIPNMLSDAFNAVKDTITVTIPEKFEDLKKKITDLFNVDWGTFGKILTVMTVVAIIISPLVAVILSVKRLLHNITSAAADLAYGVKDLSKAAKLSQMAVVIQSLTPVIKVLAVALIAMMAAVYMLSKIENPDNIDKALGAVVAIILVIGVVVGLLMLFGSVLDQAQLDKEIKTLSLRLAANVAGIDASKSRLSNELNAFAEVMKSLAIAIIAFVGALAAIMMLVKIAPDEFWIAVVTVSLIFVSLGAGIGLLLDSAKDLNLSTSKKTTFNLKDGLKIEKQGNALSSFLASIAIAFATLTAAVAVFANMDDSQMARGLMGLFAVSAVMVALMGAMNIISGTLSENSSAGEWEKGGTKYNKYTNSSKYSFGETSSKTKYDPDKAAENIKASAKAAVILGAAMMVFAGAVKVFASIPSESLGPAYIAMVGCAGLMVLVLIGMAGVQSKLSSNDPNKNEIDFTSYSKAIMEFSIGMLALAASFYILDQIDSDKMWESYRLFAAVIGAFLVAYLAIIGLDKLLKPNSESKILNSLATSFIAISVLMVAIGAALRIMPDSFDESKMGMMAIILAGCIGMIVAAYAVAGKTEGGKVSSILAASSIIYAIGGLIAIITGLLHLMPENFNDSQIAVISIMLGGVFLILLSASLLTRIASVMSSMELISVAIIIVAIGGIFVAISYMLKSLPTDMSWTSMGTMIAIMVGLAALMVCLQFPLEQMRLVSAGQLLSFAVIVAAIGGVFSAVALMLHMLPENMSWESMATMSITMIALAAMFAVLWRLVVSAKVISTSDLISVSAIIAMTAALVLAVGHLISVIPSDMSENQLWALGTSLVAVTAMLGIMVGLLAVSKGANTTAIGAVSLIIFSIAAMMGAMSFLIKAIPPEGIDLSGLTPMFVAIGVLFAIVAVLITVASIVPVADAAIVVVTELLMTMSIFMLAAAASFLLIAMGITAMASIDPETISQMGDNISSIITSIGSALTENGFEILVAALAGVALLVLVVVALNIAAIGMITLGELITIAALTLTVGIGAFGLAIIAISGMMPDIEDAFISVMDSLTAIGKAINGKMAISIIKLIALAVAFVLFGGLLMAGSIAMLSAVGILGITSILIGAIAPMMMTSFAILVTTLVTMGNMITFKLVGAIIKLVAIAALIVVCGALFLIGGGVMLVASLLFLVASTFVMLAFSNIQSTVTTFLDTLEEAATRIPEIISEFVTSFQQMGVNIVEGFVNGIESIIETIVESAQNIFDTFMNAIRDLFGIHSPSTVLEEIGMYLIEGLVNGITGNSDQATDAAEQVADGVTGAFDDTADSAEESGEETAESFGDGIENNSDAATSGINSFGSTLTSALSSVGSDGGSGMMSSLISMVGGGFGNLKSKLASLIANLKSSESPLMQRLGNALGSAFGSALSETTQEAFNRIKDTINDLKAQIAATTDAATKTKLLADEGAASTAAYYAKVYGHVTETDDSDDDDGDGSGYDPTDAADIFNSSSTSYTGSDTSSTLASDVSDSSGSGSGINDTSKSSGGTYMNNSNNTYNFTQNNYSPEALSRSEIYTQTNRQLNAWNQWRLSNNL